MSVPTNNASKNLAFRLLDEDSCAETAGQLIREIECIAQLAAMVTVSKYRGHGSVIELRAIEASAVPPNKGMERTVKIVMPFACAKVAPIFPAAHPWRYASAREQRTIKAWHFQLNGSGAADIAHP